MGYLQKHSKAIGQPPQTQPLDSKQVPNSAGGHSYQVDCWKQLERFLILGTEGGSYYAGEHELTGENVEGLKACLKADGLKAVQMIAEISDSGRAPKNDPALFALAFCMSEGGLATRQAAADALPRVARIGTHLFHFAEYAQNMRGWGRVLKQAVGEWYKEMPTPRLVEQVIKYRQRDGWTHGELLRLSHPLLQNDKDQVARWVLKSEGYKKWADSKLELPSRLQGHEELQLCTSDKAAASIIREHKLTWESVPTELLKSPAVWEALLQDMPMTALIRNLGRMTSIELLKPLSSSTRYACNRLRDELLLKKGRVHPITALNALRTYQQGHGDKGKLTWSPVSQISEALEDAFYLAFKVVEPTGKNFYLGLDVSGSMSCHAPGLSISCREGSVVMAMVTARKEQNYYLRAFGHEMLDLPVTAKTALKDALQETARLPWQGTDCALPMLDATKRKLEVDCFVVYTDSETWAGQIHPKQALDQYRQKMGRQARLVVVGMEANKFSIADPSDFGMLDVVGFDTATPQLISQFAL